MIRLMDDFEEIASEVGAAGHMKAPLTQHAQSKWVRLSGLRRCSFYPCRGGVVSGGMLPEDVEIVSEVDDAAASTAANTSTISVVWDIVHSKTYNVPVLYFNAYIDSQPMRSLDPLIAHGILKHSAHISITDHPLSNLSCYYIHPCNLSTAVDEVVAADPHAEYNRVWRMIIDTLVYIS